MTVGAYQITLSDFFNQRSATHTTNCLRNRGDLGFRITVMEVHDARWERATAISTRFILLLVDPRIVTNSFLMARLQYHFTIT